MANGLGVVQKVCDGKENIMLGLGRMLFCAQLVPFHPMTKSLSLST